MGDIDKSWIIIDIKMEDKLNIIKKEDEDGNDRRKKLFRKGVLIR